MITLAAGGYSYLSLTSLTAPLTAALLHCKVGVAARGNGTFCLHEL
jgi:hypothetical protein